jgi:hypothetical protein
LNWSDGRYYVVGLYMNPVFGQGTIPSPHPELNFDFEVNVSALPTEIHQVDSYIDLHGKDYSKKFLPSGKELGKRGFNYLQRENVCKILDVMTDKNPEDTKLKRLKFAILKQMGIT